MKTSSMRLVLATLALAASSAHGLILDLDFSRDTSGFFADATFGAARRATVTDAANTWTRYVDLPNLGFSGNSSAPYIGVTGGDRNDYGKNNIPAMQAGHMTVFVGGNNWNVDASLNGPTSTIPGYVQGHTAMTFENINSSGSLSGLRGLNTELANRIPQSGFTLSFNTAQNWVNSKTDPLASNQYDLYTTALGHIGDALAGSRGAIVLTGQLNYAFHPTRELIVGTGPNVTATANQFGGDAYVVYANGLPFNEVFSGGQLFDDTFIIGAGNGLSGSYPKNGELRLPVIATEAMFKPGTRRLEPGQYDIAMLSDLGYTAVVPEPSTYALMGLGLGVIIFLSRRKKIT